MVNLVSRIFSFSLIFVLLVGQIRPLIGAEAIKTSFLPGLYKGDGSSLFILWPYSSSDKNLRRDFLDYFFTALMFPDKSLWVNLSPMVRENEILGKGLGLTKYGKVLARADVQIKRDMMMLLSSMCMDEESLETPVSFRVWVEPKEVELIEGDRGVIITKALLKVEIETRNTVFSTALLRHVVPLLEQKINCEKEYEALRYAYFSTVLAYWVKRHSQRTAALSIVSFKDLPFTTVWSKRRILDEYLDLYYASSSNGEIISGGISLFIPDRIVHFRQRKGEEFIKAMKSSDKIALNNGKFASLIKNIEESRAWKRLEKIGEMFPSFFLLDKDVSFTNRIRHVERGILAALSFNKRFGLGLDDDLVRLIGMVSELGRLPGVHFCEGIIDKYLPDIPELGFNHSGRKRFNQPWIQERVYEKDNLPIPKVVIEDVEAMLRKDISSICTAEARLFYIADKCLGYVEDFALLASVAMEGERFNLNVPGIEEFCVFVFGKSFASVMEEIKHLRVENFDDYVVDYTVALMERVFDKKTISIKPREEKVLDNLRKEIFDRCIFPARDKRIYKLLNWDKVLAKAVEQLKDEAYSRGLKKEGRDVELFVLNRLLEMGEDEMIKIAGVEGWPKIVLRWVNRVSSKKDIGGNEVVGSLSLHGGVRLITKGEDILAEKINAPLIDILEDLSISKPQLQGIVRIIKDENPKVFVFEGDLDVGQFAYGDKNGIFLNKILLKVLPSGLLSLVLLRECFRLLLAKDRVKVQFVKNKRIIEVYDKSAKRIVWSIPVSYDQAQILSKSTGKELIEFLFSKEINLFRDDLLALSAILKLLRGKVESNELNYYIEYMTSMGMEGGLVRVFSMLLDRGKTRTISKSNLWIEEVIMEGNLEDLIQIIEESSGITLSENLREELVRIFGNLPLVPIVRAVVLLDWIIARNLHILNDNGGEDITTNLLDYIWVHRDNLQELSPENYYLIFSIHKTLYETESSIKPDRVGGIIF